ncbi:hypothetical protein DTO027B5_3663 [Paecilomyces variotii]|nr:hypothetical protein DTO032I3_4954 [Paecilomyces variotii]KAJ9254988.1 hypothetical protein DTO195F2_6472 [Paecilomyces variotii]KAJ9277156.1 hypothetical protein DTO021D3_6053 [Paecilomyces variotii]KAJ9283421.1 hypothetical protein DTO021C3_8986 [Paecilomyces variotii]KAJ9327864.1 hypothetical protein DTO027B3_1572 [Paecilomyces variotii]
MPLTVTANPPVDTNGAQGVVDISLHHQQKLLIFETQRLIMFAGNVLYRLISYRMINFRRIAITSASTVVNSFKTEIIWKCINNATRLGT